MTLICVSPLIRSWFWSSYLTRNYLQLIEFEVKVPPKPKRKKKRKR